MTVPAAARQALVPYWDRAYDTVAIGRIHLPHDFRTGEVCGFMFNSAHGLVDRQQAKIEVPSSGLAVHVDVHLRGEGDPSRVCGSCTTIQS